MMNVTYVGRKSLARHVDYDGKRYVLPRDETVEVNNEVGGYISDTFTDVDVEDIPDE